MFLTILLIFLGSGFAISFSVMLGLAANNKKLFNEKQELWANYRNEEKIHHAEELSLGKDRDDRVAEVKRLTNKLIEVQNHANLVEEDAAARIEDFKKQPMIACMNDGQVAVLAEMLVSYIRQLLELKKEYIN